MTDDDLRDDFGDELTDALRLRSRRAAATDTAFADPSVTPRVRPRRGVLIAALAAVLVLTGIGVIATRGHGSTGIRVTAPPSSTTTATPASIARLSTGVQDWTWVSDTRGWTLVREPCGTTVCIGVRETVDGGRTWTALPAPDALDSDAVANPDVACAARPCLSRVRFATAKIGWLFGPALYLTADGGHSWTRARSASVSDVEAAAGIAMRITTTDRDCGSGCSYHIDRMRLGSSSWQRVPTGPQYQFPSLLLQGRDAYDVEIPNWAGAGETHLRVSEDAGTTWRSIGDPCPGPPGDFRTASASAAPGGVLVVLCESVDEGSATVRVSTDRGQTFGPRLAVPHAPGGLWPVAAGSARTIAIAYSDERAYGVVVSHDGGRTWRRTLVPSAPPTQATTLAPSLGWQDARTARASFNTGAIWTTDDGGRTWTQNRVTP